MNIRRLQLKDAPLMLEWMHDPDVVKNMRGDFWKKTLEDCQSFISAAQNTCRNLHLAVVDMHDTYMGTVSLKNISDGAAEFAIVVRTCAMGKGYAQFAMAEILQIGFDQRDLDVIYWCVSSENRRAVHFYNKCGYPYVEKEAYYSGMDEYTLEEQENLVWYYVKRDG